MYDILLTKEAQAFYDKADNPLAKRLNRCLEQLRREPHQHPSIKRLHGPLTGFFRYRIGDWRVVYRVDEDGAVVVILIITHRSSAYD